MFTSARSLSALLLGFGLMAVFHAAPASAAQGQMDLNSAPESELAELPGVNRQMARRIIQNRPYASVNELSKVGMTNSGVLSRIAQFTAQRYTPPATDATAKHAH